jgi:serine/threonine-protein kinase
MLRSGEMIGPYTLINRLGSGAYGTVWLAERRTAIATTKVALKIPLNDDFDIEVIKQEANLWVQASGHPNILPIIEANIYQDQVVIVSEYAPDGSLSNWLKEKTFVPLETAIEMTCGILAGLEYLHNKKIIHRDLKPDNILLQGEIPRLADFGIARILRSNTQSTMVAGTPSYMSPESFFGKHNLQADLWATTVILYKLLTGKMPFPQTNLPVLMKAIIEEEPTPLPESIPVAIKKIIYKAFAKTPSDRYLSAYEMRSALKQAHKNVRNPNEKIFLDGDLVVNAEDYFALDKTRSLYPNLSNQLQANALDNSYSNFDNSFGFPIGEFLKNPPYNFTETPTSAINEKYNPTNYSLPALVTENLENLQNIEKTDLIKKTIPTRPTKLTALLYRSKQIKFSYSLSKINYLILDILYFSRLTYQQVVIAITNIFNGINLSFLRPSKIPRRAYLVSLIMLLLCLLLMDDNLVGKAYNNISTSLKIKHSQIIQNLSFSNEEEEISTNLVNQVDISTLVGQALNEVNYIIIRIEKELPSNDPSKLSNLTRFNSFRQGLENYCKGSITPQQAREYAESALSQSKSVNLQLDEKKKKSPKASICQAKRKIEISSK